jgi:homoserine kinase
MSERISVRVPATSANLGCAFDCAALALGLYLDLHIAPRSDGTVSVAYQGVNPERVTVDKNNLVVRTITSTLESWGKNRGFDLEIDNQIPVGVGLGSSAAAIVGALAACHWLADRPLSDEELVSLAALEEGHPDNVAAAWHGGFTVTVQHEYATLACSCPVPDSVRFVLVVPDYALSTEKARQVLPPQYSRADAIHNLQRAVMLAAQFFSGRARFRPSFFADCWHQPYRAALIPGLSEVLSLSHPDLRGVCLSGAGPSILAFASCQASAIGELICQTLARHGVNARARILTADNEGAKGRCLPCSAESAREGRAERT